jgi:hypothetical protein
MMRVQNLVRWAAVWIGISYLGGCATYSTLREIKLVGFDEDVSKGKSVGQIEGGDCVYHIFGHWLGGNPTISRAFANARKQRTTGVADAVGGDTSQGDPLRYINNAQVTNDGFDAVVFGKSCIMVTGMGFK